MKTVHIVNTNVKVSPCAFPYAWPDKGR